MLLLCLTQTLFQKSRARDRKAGHNRAERKTLNKHTPTHRNTTPRIAAFFSLHVSILKKKACLFTDKVEQQRKKKKDNRPLPTKRQSQSTSMAQQSRVSSQVANGRAHRQTGRVDNPASCRAQGEGRRLNRKENKKSGTEANTEDGGKGGTGRKTHYKYRNHTQTDRQGGGGGGGHRSTTQFAMRVGGGRPLGVREGWPSRSAFVASFERPSKLSIIRVRM